MVLSSAKKMAANNIEQKKTVSLRRAKEAQTYVLHVCITILLNCEGLGGGEVEEKKSSCCKKGAITHTHSHSLLSVLAVTFSQ